MSEDVAGLIMVREGSQRVKQKNFREFIDGKSLLDLKIEHLRESGCFDHIYLSSDSERVKKIAAERDVEFLLRDTKYCQADVLLSEVFEHILNTIPGDPIVVWALVTSPLFSDFKTPVETFIANREKHDSLVAVLPRKSFYLNEHGRGINYNPGWWHPYSQQLETYYEVTGACYIAKKSDMLKWKYWFGVTPYLYPVRKQEAVDVDDQEDFDLARELYQIKNISRAG